MEREAKMKKIACRQSDRMAHITDRAQALDPNLSSSISNNRGQNDPKQAEKPSFQDCHPGGDIKLHSEPRNANDNEISKQKQAAISSSLVATGKFSDPKKPFEHHLSSISPREINFSIISSENTRAICSFTIAVLVVLSHVDLPHNVVKSKSLIDYRPLYAVLVTDTLIVGVRLALYLQGRRDDHNHREVNFEVDGTDWGRAIKLLEWGLVLHQTLRAIFIDCSFYLAVVVCGLSLV